MKTMYKIFISSFSCLYDIEEIQVERETEKSVWVDGRRYCKNTEYGHIFDTWEEAKNELLTKQEDRVAILCIQIASARETLENIKNLKK